MPHTMNASLGQPLKAALFVLAEGIETQLQQSHCIVMLLDQSRQQLITIAAPSLPADYTELIDSIPIGPMAGSCGTAAYSGKIVVSSDLASDPSWVPWRELAYSYNLRACIAVPFFSSTGNVLGIFAVYYTKPHTPDPQDLAQISEAAHIAAVAIKRWQTLDALRASEANLEVEQTRQETQGLESLGVLAGGIAHDFNNLLAGIQGYSGLALLDLPEQSPILKNLIQINQTVDQAARLTRQLLAYADMGRLSTQLIDVSELIAETQRQINAALATSMIVSYHLTPELPSVAFSKPSSTTPPMVESVLVVDDEPDVRQIAARLLERIGYRTIAATDGAQALAMFQSKAKQILWILLDWTMPGVHGVELISALRAIRSDIPIVVMSGYGIQEIGLPFEALGLNRFIQKPFRMNDLRAIVPAL